MLEKHRQILRSLDSDQLRLISACLGADPDKPLTDWLDERGLGHVEICLALLIRGDELSLRTLRQLTRYTVSKLGPDWPRPMPRRHEQVSSFADATIAWVRRGHAYVHQSDKQTVRARRGSRVGDLVARGASPRYLREQARAGHMAISWRVQ